MLAGAGSGKTSVITRKIAYLIEQAGIPGRHIAAVTFTNKAAREMKERVGKLVDRKLTRGLTVSTFHNLGMHIIREELAHLGYHPGFSIFDAEDAKALLQDLMLREASADAGDELADIQHTISAWKNDMKGPEDAWSRAADEREQRIALIYKRYQQYLKAYNAVDFDDLILLPVQLFRTVPEALAKWRRKIRYMLVDEYQDTNLCQYELVKLLVAERAAFTWWVMMTSPSMPGGARGRESGAAERGLPQPEDRQAGTELSFHRPHPALRQRGDCQQSPRIRESPVERPHHR